MVQPDFLLGGIFAAVIIGFLVIDLGFFERRAKKISLRSAFWQTFFWIAISVAFGLLLGKLEGSDAAFQFFSAYLTEKILSVDNLFVILLIFTYFEIEEQYHHRVLFWGILGAIILRAIFIGIGSAVVSEFHWVLYIFGAILIWSGLQLLGAREDKHRDLSKSKTLQFLQNALPLTTEPHHGRFTLIERGRRVATTLLVVLIMIEVSDLIFAVDSIPAAFAISQQTFIIYTSNIFAVMGLRAMFFLLEDVVHKVRHLAKALAFILVFIGLKMLAEIAGVHIGSGISFGIILAALLFAGGFSYWESRQLR